MKKLIAFGDANVDLVTEIPHTPIIDMKQPRPEVRLMGGGTIGNTSVGTSRLGIDTRFLGKLGLDGYGRFLKEGFEADGIDTSFLIEDPRYFTIMVLAFIDSAGEKHNVTFPPEGGAYHKITIDEIAKEVWEDAGWFHTSGIPLGEDPSRSTTLSLMKEAKRRGLRLSFDLNLRLEFFGWRPKVKEAVLEAMALSDVVFASLEEELQPLTGKSEAAECINALKRLYPRGRQYLEPSGQIIIARCGARPAKVFDHGRSFDSPCFEVEVADSLGAGDAFNAGYIAASMKGARLEEALLNAHAAAGFNLTQRGARGMPKAAELNHFISTHKRQI